MEENKKITKRDKLGMLKEILGVANIEDEDTANMLVEFIDAEIAAADKKAEKAKERAAEKRAEGDDLRARVKDVLTEEYQTIDEIFGQIEAKEDEELTKQKIVARLTQLVNNGDAEKADVESGERKVKGYKLAD